MILIVLFDSGWGLTDNALITPPSMQGVINV